MSNDDLIAAQVEEAQEATILDRLETLGKQQGDIFKEQHAARMRTLLVGLVGFLVAALLAGLLIAVNSRTSNTAELVHQMQAQRTEARAAACQQDQIRIAQHNALADSLQHILDLVNIPNPNRTADQQAAADRFFADSRAAIDKSRVAARDCTTAGIDAYYSTSSSGG